MSTGINYSIGGDASGLGKAFQHALRYTGDFTDQIKRAFSIRGLFDGLATGLKETLGGGGLGDIFSNALRKAMGKEVLQQNFAGLLKGDEMQATAMIDAIKAFSDESNIAVDKLNDAAREMMSAGGASSGRVVQDLKMLGEVAIATQTPIGELARTWAKMLSDGAVSTRELKGLQDARVNVEALAEAAGMTGEQFQKLATDGKLVFGTVEAAMRTLTTTGIYAGQIARFKGTFAGLVDDIQDELAKIPTSFFAGLLNDGMPGAKDNLRAITGIVEGWVSGAREFGANFAAGVRVAKDLWDQGTLGNTLLDGLQAAFGGAIDFLTKGLVGVATGFAAGLYSAIKSILSPEALAGLMKAAMAGAAGARGIAASDFFKEDMAKLVASATGQPAPKPIERSPDFGSIGGGVVAGLMAGFNSTVGPGLGKEAAARLEAVLGPLWRKATGEQEPGFIGPRLNAQSRAALGIGGGLAAPNNPRALEYPTAIWKGIEPDALSKIGLHVGSGGAQGEAHARDTAKNTQKTAEKTAELVTVMKRKQTGLTVFRGG